MGSAWANGKGPALTSRADYDALVAREMSEGVLQTHCIRIAVDLGWGWYHTHDSRKSRKGWPDLALWHPVQRRVLFRELKTMSGTTTGEQRRVLAELTEAGADVGVWRPVDLLEGRVLAELQEVVLDRGVTEIRRGDGTVIRRITAGADPKWAPEQWVEDGPR